MPFSDRDLIPAICTAITLELLDNIFILDDGRLARVTEVVADRRGRMTFEVLIDGEEQKRYVRLK